MLLEFIDEDWMTKPSRHFIARAIPTGTKFRAAWAAPGLLPDYVYDGDVPELFNTAEAAEAKAKDVLLSALNARAGTKVSRTGKPEISKRMTGSEFAVLLAEAGLEPSEFAQMWGTTSERVLSWIDDEQDVPFPIRWALHLLKRPEAMEQAVAIVEANVNYRPKWLAWEANRNRLRKLIDHIKRHLPKNPDETTFKFEHATQTDGIALSERVRLLEEVAAELGAPLAADSTRSTANFEFG